MQKQNSSYVFLSLFLYAIAVLPNKYLCISDSITYDLLLSPVSIAVGILYGLVWGFIVKYVPERTDVSIKK